MGFDDVDLSISSDTLPSCQVIATWTDRLMIDANWEDLRDNYSNTRKAFTKFTAHCAGHPYLEKFVLTREMTAPENSHRAVAIANLSHIVYHVLWHLRVKHW